MKKKILAITLCVAMLAIMLVSGTLAYFTDEKAQTNTFTAGKVEITLDEAVVVETPNADGDLPAVDAENNRTTDNQEYELFPAMIVDKDPTITLASDSEDAYLAAIITVTFDPETANVDLLTEIGLRNPNWPMLDVEKFLEGDFIGHVDEKPNYPLKHEAGKVYGNDAYSVFQIGDEEDLTYTIYMFFEGAKPAGTEITPFNKLKIPAEWDNEEMAAVNGMEISVAAYAAQTVGFADCYTAMTTAFPTAFPFANQN